MTRGNVSWRVVCKAPAHWALVVALQSLVPVPSFLTEPPFYSGTQPSPNGSRSVSTFSDWLQDGHVTQLQTRRHHGRVPQVASWLVRQRAKNPSISFFLWMSLCLTKVFRNAAAILFPASRSSYHKDARDGKNLGPW